MQQQEFSRNGRHTDCTLSPTKFKREPRYADADTSTSTPVTCTNTTKKHNPAKSPKQTKSTPPAPSISVVTGAVIDGDQGAGLKSMIMRPAFWLLRPDVEAWNRWFGGGDCTLMDLYATLASHSTLSHIRFGLFDRVWGFEWFRRLMVSTHSREKGSPAVNVDDKLYDDGEEVRVPFEVKTWAKNEIVLGRMAEVPSSTARGGKEDVYGGNALREKNMLTHQFLTATASHDAEIALRELLRICGICPAQRHPRSTDLDEDRASGAATIQPFFRCAAGSSLTAQQARGTNKHSEFQLVMDDDAYAFLERWARDDFPQSNHRDWCSFAAFALSHCQVYQVLQLQDKEVVESDTGHGSSAEAYWDDLRKNNEHWKRAGQAPNSFFRNLQAEALRRRTQSSGGPATSQGDDCGDSSGSDEGETNVITVHYSDFDTDDAAAATATADATPDAPHNLLPGITSNFQGGFFQPGLNGAALGFHFTLDNVEVPIGTTSLLHRRIRDMTESWLGCGSIPPCPPPKLPDCVSSSVLYEFDPSELRNLPALWDFRRGRPRFGGSVDTLRAFLTKQGRRKDAAELLDGDERWARDLHTLSLPAIEGNKDEDGGTVMLTDFNLVGLFGDLRVFTTDDDDGDGGPSTRRLLFSKRNTHVTLWANYLCPDEEFWSAADGVATLDFLLNVLSERVEKAKPLFGEPRAVPFTRFILYGRENERGNDEDGDDLLGNIDGNDVGRIRTAPGPEEVDCGALFASLVDAAPSTLPIGE